MMFDNYRSINGDERIARRTITKITQRKILDARYWWPTMYRNVHDYYKSCDACQIT